MQAIIGRFYALCITITLMLANAANAHEIRPAIADLFLENGEYRLEIQLNLEAIIAEIGSEAKNTAESPNADQYDALRALPPAELDAAFDRTEFVEKISVLLDGELTHPVVLSVEIPEIGDVELRRDSHIVVTGNLGNSQELRLGWDAAYGEIVIRLMDEQNDFNAYLTKGSISDPISTIGATVIGFWANLLNYIFVGFDHIIPLGIDHILFVVGLFLLSTRLKPLVWQISAFTAAHTVTLALGVLGILTIPAGIVEPLIAASIVYVCVENIFMTKLSRWRPLLIFGFGLLHGQGFAGALTEFGLTQNNIASGLIGFNLGVELGQITVILVCFLAVGFWFSRRPWYRQYVTIPASVVIALIGSYWVVERIFL
ncbi:MAG: HupE/UreJ family protein [Rhodobacteraceae bacterium]|nr:HupE/UreJ family protein [Paracoccaceae bacterium]